MKVSCHVAICFLMLVISKSFPLTASFLMRCSITSAILVPIMCRMLRLKRPQFFKGGMWKAPISHIPIIGCWWGWRVKLGTYCNCWIWRLYRICVGLPLTYFLMLGMYWFSNCLRESRRCISPSTWSYWWRWRILLSLWWLLFLWTWCIISPRVSVSVSKFLFLEVQGGFSGVSEQWSTCVQENWRREEYTFSFWGVFPVPVCLSRQNQEKWSERRVFLFQCKSLMQIQIPHRIHKSRRRDKGAYKMWRFWVGGSLVVRLILVSCLCVLIGIFLVPGHPNRPILFCKRTS